MLGTYLLVLVGSSSVVAASLIPFPYELEGLLFVALVFGVTVALIILLVGKRSGAHINPAITVASGLTGVLRRRLLFPYVVFQMVGGLLAGLSLRILLGSLSSPTRLGSTKLAAGLSPLEGIALEALGTFLLAYSALSASTFVRAPLRQAVLVGSTLFVLILLLGTLTGASLNPIRSLGPAVFSGYFDNQIVYWVGPLVGGAVAGLIFRLARGTHGGSRALPIVCVC